jgi:hypothetical protein
MAIQVSYLGGTTSLAGGDFLVASRALTFIFGIICLLLAATLMIFDWKVKKTEGKTDRWASVTFSLWFLFQGLGLICLGLIYTLYFNPADIGFISREIKVIIMSH